MNKIADKATMLPLIPSRNLIFFPFLSSSFVVARPDTVTAVEAAAASEDKYIVVVGQRDPEVDEPKINDFYEVGTLAVIRKLTRAHDAISITTVGVERVRLLELEQSKPYMIAKISAFPMPDDTDIEVEALHNEVLALSQKLAKLIQPNLPFDLNSMLYEATDSMHLVFLIASLLPLTVQQQQVLLESPSRKFALTMVHQHLAHELKVLELRQKIAINAASELSREQRDFLLRQQLQSIQQELGERDPEQAAIESIKSSIEELQVSEEVKREARRELSRLQRMSISSPDYQLSRTYLEFILELPWSSCTQDNLDMARARSILDEDHFDLDEVKERILEHLAILKLNPEAKSPILCFVGPPGVGKTSLGQSIARALGRKFEHMSLGGLHDEAELRGHRRTYIGAMPGRIIQAVRRADANNPIIMLDEVDKLGRDFRGDPAAALLEILDPAQNFTFRDNYLDLPFDLSKVFFITTANTTDTIPQALFDRMELIRLPGYTEEEKIEICNRYLLPRQLHESGLKAEQLKLPQETLECMIKHYTRESGMRQFDRALARICRKIALKSAEGSSTSLAVSTGDLFDLLGPEHFLPESARESLPPGVAVGLAWTESGGEIMNVEAVLLPNGNALQLTGQLGEVMQESAKTAHSCIWSLCEFLGIQPGLFKCSGIHIHVPAGATPKDGPSAGITIATAIASIYTKKPVRNDTAMTGEITLTGLVLPVGGIKEKILAARRAGIHRIIVPEGNKQELRLISDSIRKELEIILVTKLEDVLLAAIPELTKSNSLARTVANV